MYNKLLVVFLILLIGLILFQFLGNSKYFMEGFSNMINFVSPDGSKAAVSDSVAVVTSSDGTKTTYNKSDSDSKTGPYGVSTMYTSSDGKTALMTTGNTGTSVFYTKNADGSGQVSFTQVEQTTDTNADTNSNDVSSISGKKFISPDGSKAVVSDSVAVVTSSAMMFLPYQVKNLYLLMVLKLLFLILLQ